MPGQNISKLSTHSRTTFPLAMWTDTYHGGFFVYFSIALYAYIKINKNKNRRLDVKMISLSRFAYLY